MNLSSAGLICMLTAAAMTLFMDAHGKRPQEGTPASFPYFVHR
ncbi:hypothetical protein [Roseibium suaedae]|uniref:Uncharacterized protein n=1 Tax=Roseibium suaedae TaxID=735517 RepID=A0A1M7LM47_9HYPH|nr:hypothetical protein [Roseibium suaedae]SHM78718.1 hypothetical protein SAMN05444272_3237 [Roseibium suaedae]